MPAGDVVVVAPVCRQIHVNWNIWQPVRASVLWCRNRVILTNYFDDWFPSSSFCLKRQQTSPEQDHERNEMGRTNGSACPMISAHLLDSLARYRFCLQNCLLRNFFGAPGRVLPNL